MLIKILFCSFIFLLYLCLNSNWLGKYLENWMISGVILKPECHKGTMGIPQPRWEWLDWTMVGTDVSCSSWFPVPHTCLSFQTCALGLERFYLTCYCDSGPLPCADALYTKGTDLWRWDTPGTCSHHLRLAIAAPRSDQSQTACIPGGQELRLQFMLAGYAFTVYAPKLFYQKVSRIKCFVVILFVLNLCTYIVNK